VGDKYVTRRVILLGLSVKGDEVGGACSIHVTMRNPYRIFSGNLEQLGIGGRIMYCKDIVHWSMGWI
jgi:hypothetical protein